MIFDSHIHSEASPDGKTSPEEAIAILQKKGLGCIFTEHIEYNAELEPVFCVDFDKYPNDYIQYKSDSVLLGVELNLIPEAIELNRQHGADPNYDFVLGSVHVIDGIDLGAMPDHAKKWFEELGEEAYQHFFDISLEMVETNDFYDSFGHIDYVSRYSSLPEKNVLYEKYVSEYSRLLDAIIQKGKVLELCTRRIGDKLASENLFKIYKRYQELGGRYVTMGSDAHVPDQLGYKFDIALDMINEIGLAPVYFKERRMMLK